MKIAFAALTDVGLVRQNNEDSFLVLDLASRKRYVPAPPSCEGSAEPREEGLLLAVADGMGGALAGEVASRMAVEALALAAAAISAETGDEECRSTLMKGIGSANLAIFDQAQANPQQRGMGTTLTAAYLHRGRVGFFQVGDSKGYRYVRLEGRLHQMTKAHSLIDTLVDDGVISTEDAEQLQGGKNIILRAIGAEAEVKVDYTEGAVAEGDVVLLASDGLHGCVKAKEIEEIVRLAVDPGKLCEDLVRAARAHGAPDNVTVIAVSVLDVEGEAAEPQGILGRIGALFKRGK